MPDIKVMIAEISSDVKHIKSRVDKINGSMEDHEERIRASEIRIEAKDGDCRVHTGRTKQIEKDVSRIFKRMSPYKIILLIGSIQAVVGLGTVLVIAKLMN